MEQLWHKLLQGVLAEAFHDTRMVGVVARYPPFNTALHAHGAMS